MGSKKALAMGEEKRPRERAQSWKASAKKRGYDKAKIIIAIFFCLIIVNALYYAFTHVEGISEYGDDPTYTNLAGALLQGNYKVSPTYIFSLRLTEVFAIGFFYKIFGITDFTSALWNMTSYIGIIMVTFLVVKLFYDDKAALISAFLVSIFPLVAKFAVNIGEDIPLTFLTSLAILLFLYAERNDKKIYYFSSGVVLVLSWLTSYEAGLVIFFVLVYALIELLRKRIRISKTTLCFLLGIAVMFGIVFTYTYFNSGAFFTTVIANSNFYSAVGGSVNGVSTIPSTNTDLNFYINAMFQYQFLNALKHSSSIWQALQFISGELFGTILNYEYGLYFYMLIPIAVLLIIFREKRAYFLMFWVAFLWLGLEIGPMHIGLTLNPLAINYLLAYRLTRFMLIISVPLVGVIGIGLAKLLEPENTVLLVIGAVALLLILAVLYLNNYYTSNFWYYWQHYPNTLIGQAATYLRGVNPNAPIYLEAYYNNAYVGYSEGPISTLLGAPSSGRVDYNIGPNTNCTTFSNGSYVIWAGPAHCAGWTNVLNITVPSSIPSYMIQNENPNMGYIITNVYYVNSTYSS